LTASGGSIDGEIKVQKIVDRSIMRRLDERPEPLQDRQDSEFASEVEKRRSDVVLTRKFKETIQERARRDAAFREALLKEAVDALL
jgi:hypothetical protein